MPHVDLALDLLYGVESTDVSVLLAASTTVLGVALAAGFRPAGALGILRGRTPQAATGRRRWTS